MANIILDNNITYEGSGSQVLDALVVETINRMDLMEDHKKYASLMNFIDTALLSPDQKYSVKAGVNGLDSVDELGLKKLRTMTFGSKKGVYQKELGNKFTLSYLMSKWIKTAKNIKEAPMGVQGELADFGDQARDLITGYDISRAEELVKVLTGGFAVTAASGPGSSTPDGLSLFNASHVTFAGGTQSNLVTGPSYTNTATGTVQLQAAIDKLRAMKDKNGKKIRLSTGTPFKLFCSRAREVFWRQVLNDGSNFSGQGTNANQLNQFNFKGNIVEIVVLDLLGDFDKDGNMIGTDDMWFVMNPTYIQQAKALRTYMLYSPVVKTYQDDATDAYVTQIRAIVGADHYGAELGIVGCQS